MFAVILLGIGFIMVAAMFPVAIQQSRGSTEETAASALARAAMVHLQHIATETTMPQSSNVPAMNDAFWNAIKGATIDQADARYAWTALYRRPNGTPTAQVYIFVIQARNKSRFNLNDVDRPTGADSAVWPASIEPKPVRIRQRYDAANNPLNAFDVQDVGGAPMPAAAEGAFVILRGHRPGRIVRLGNPVDRSAGVWELPPGNDLSYADRLPMGQLIEGFIIGRGYHPDTPTSGLTSPPQFEGPAMDIAVLTGFVSVK